MTNKFMADPVTGQCALFTEIGTTGAFDDPTAARNAPLLSPASHLGNLKFHSDLDHFEVAFSGSASIVHAAISAISVPAGQNLAFEWNAASDDQLLFTHSLGYVPFVLVVVGSNILWPGMPVQAVTGGARYASAYADTTTVRIATTAAIGATAMPSQATTYSYLVFKDPPAAFGNVLFDFDPGTGIVSMGLGKFSSDRAYLQVVPGGSPFGFAMGRSIDLNNGAPRAWKPDGTTVDAVPTGLKSFLLMQSYDGATIGTPPVGNDMSYGGAYGGPTAIQVQAP